MKKKRIVATPLVSYTLEIKTPNVIQSNEKAIRNIAKEEEGQINNETAHREFYFMLSSGSDVITVTIELRQR